jgi:hypothetical protein
MDSPYWLCWDSATPFKMIRYRGKSQRCGGKVVGKNGVQAGIKEIDGVRDES